MTAGLSAAAAINFALVIVSVCVLVQSVRMDRRIRTLRDNNLSEAVGRLDRATYQARLVLEDLRFVLANDVAARADAAAAAEALREELVMMVDIGNSVAERISDAAREAQAADVAARSRSARTARLEAAQGAADAEALASARTTELSSRVFDILSAHVPSAHVPRDSAVA